MLVHLGIFSPVLDVFLPFSLLHLFIFVKYTCDCVSCAHVLQLNRCMCICLQDTCWHCVFPSHSPYFLQWRLSLNWSSLCLIGWPVPGSACFPSPSYNTRVMDVTLGVGICDEDLTLEQRALNGLSYDPSPSSRTLQSRAPNADTMKKSISLFCSAFKGHWHPSHLPFRERRIQRFHMEKSAHSTLRHFLPLVDGGSPDCPYSHASVPGHRAEVS